MLCWIEQQKVPGLIKQKQVRVFFRNLCRWRQESCDRQWTSTETTVIARIRRLIHLRKSKSAFIIVKKLTLDVLIWIAVIDQNFECMHFKRRYRYIFQNNLRCIGLADWRCTKYKCPWIYKQCIWCCVHLLGQHLLQINWTHGPLWYE